MISLSESILLYLCPLSHSSSTISYKHVFLITRGPTLLSPEGDEEGVQVGAVDRLGGGGEGKVLQDEHHYRVAGLSLIMRPQSKAVEKVSQKLEISLFEDWLQGEGST